MRRLMLLRHAKSDQSGAAVNDRDRPLNPRGRRAASAVGAYLVQAKLVPSIVLCSTSKRTRETFTRLAAAFAAPPRVEYEEELYLADAGTMLALIRSLPDAAASAMLIGHNPGMHHVACDLAGSGSADARHRLNSKFPTAALAVLDFRVDHWSGVVHGGGRLERYITPRTLAEAD